MAAATLAHPPAKEERVMVEMDVEPKPLQPRWHERYVQPCVAELLGSALFVFLSCLSVVEDTEGTGRLQPALVHGLAMVLAGAILGHISGSHLNPAVSLSMWLVGGLKVTMLVPYWVSQLCGGMIGAGLTKAVAAAERYVNASGGAFSGIVADKQVPSILVGEIILTAVLILVVYVSAVNEKTKTPLAPFCIGFTVMANILAGGGVSGACMNPARAFGPAVVANYWDYHWIYWVGPMVPALVIGVLGRLLICGQTTCLV